MSSPLSAKRRKFNDATNRLKKPFVSPMKVAKLQQADTPSKLKEVPGKLNSLHEPYIPSALAHTVKSAYCPPEQPSLESSPARVMKTPARKLASFARLVSQVKNDPEERAARKIIAGIELQIRKVQNDLDVLKQAENLSSSSTDADLEALSEKWRLASQAVAEELFGSVKERVCRMGGVAAWREMEKKKYERSHGIGDAAQEEQVDDDADCEFDSQGEELPEDEQNHRKAMKRRAKQEAMDAADAPDQPELEENSETAKPWQEAGQDDDTFTVDMMLRSLNIELSVIGWDRQAQRWIN